MVRRVTVASVSDDILLKDSKRDSVTSLGRQVLNCPSRTAGLLEAQRRVGSIAVRRPNGFAVGVQIVDGPNAPTVNRNSDPM